MSESSSDARPSSGRPLFLEQALEHANVRQYGTVVLAGVRCHRILTAFYLAMAVALIAFFILFSTTRKAHCMGILLPAAGVLRIVPPQAGLVVHQYVHEGKAVQAGEVLFVLSSESSSTALKSTQAAISGFVMHRRDSLSNDLWQAKKQGAERIAAAKKRMEEISADAGRIADQIALQRRRLALSEQSYDRFSLLQSTNYLSAAQLQDKQVEVLEQRQRLAELERVAAANSQALFSAEAEMRDLTSQLDREIGAIERNGAAIEQELAESEARRAVFIRAPKDGVVTAITTEPGQTVPGNVALASLLPAGVHLEAEIYAPSRSIGFIQPGMEVLLRYQAYPYQKFGQYKARVREVSSTSLPANQLIPHGDSSPATEPLYRIRLTLDKQSVTAYGRPMPLKSGMLVDASVLLEKRRLYEWVLEPLASLSGRL